MQKSDAIFGVSHSPAKSRKIMRLASSAAPFAGNERVPRIIGKVGSAKLFGDLMIDRGDQIADEFIVLHKKCFFVEEHP